MTEPQNIGIVLSLLGAVGWVFKVWIITPLNMSVDRLNDSLSRIEGIIDNIQKQSAETLQKTTANESSAKSAHKRIDELTERVHTLERRCIECKLKDD